MSVYGREHLEQRVGPADAREARLVLPDDFHLPAPASDGASPSKAIDFAVLLLAQPWTD
jgi:hypothetical protein